MKWCQRFPQNQYSAYRFTCIGSRLFINELAEDVYLAANAILAPLITREVIPARIHVSIYRAFSYLVSASSLQTEEFQNKVDGLFLTWLRNPISFGDSTTHQNNQRLAYFQRVANLIVENKLSIQNDRQDIEKFLRWVNLWEEQNKVTIIRSLNYLKTQYPDPLLWETIQFVSSLTEDVPQRGVEHDD